LESMPADQAAALAPQMDRLTGPMVLVGGSLGGVVSLLISFLVSAALLYFGGLVIGAELDFTPLLPFVVWTWMPFFFRDLVQAAITVAQRGLIANQGLSWLVSVGDAMKDARSFTWFALSFVEVFFLWHLILVWAGLRGAGKLSGGKATVLTIVYAAVTIAVRWIPSLLARVFSPGLNG
jgi:hypothetical protein